MDLDELERLLREATALRAQRNFALKEEQRALDPLYSKAEAELSEALRNCAEELIRDARRYREAEELGRYQDCGDKHRDWLSVGAWLYPGDRIVVVRDAIAQEGKG